MVERAAEDACAHDVAVSFDGRLARELREAGSPPHVLGDVRFRPSRHGLAGAPRAAARADGRALRRGHRHAPWSAALSARPVRRASVPLLMWAHDAPQPDEWPERRIARVPPDRFICNSRHTAARSRGGCPASRDVVHPPVVAPQCHTRIGADVRRELGESDERP